MKDNQSKGIRTFKKNRDVNGNCDQGKFTSTQRRDMFKLESKIRNINLN